MDKRLNITISFTDENADMYYHVKNKPNSSYYIRKLVEKDMSSKHKDNINEEFKEIAIDMLDW